METIGERICKLREKSGFSQAYVGLKVGVSRVAVTKWESGQTSNMKLENLTGLCKLFSVTYDYLIDGKESGNDKNVKFVSKKDKKIRNIIDNLPHLDEDELDATKNVTNAFKNKTPAKKAQNEEDQ